MKPAGIGSLNTPPWTFLLVQPRGWRVRGIRTAERSWDLAQLHREPSFINLWTRIRPLCSLYAQPIMAPGKMQGTGCALVSNLKVPEALLSFHQANMGWPASSWISAPGVAKRRVSGGHLGNSPWTARRIWSSRLAWRGLSWKSHCCPSGRGLQLRTLDPLSRAGQAWVCLSLRGTCWLPRKGAKSDASGAANLLWRRPRQDQSRSGAPSGGARCPTWASTLKTSSPVFGVGFGVGLDLPGMCWTEPARQRGSGNHSALIITSPLSRFCSAPQADPQKTRDSLSC